MKRRSFFGVLVAPFVAALIPFKPQPPPLTGGFLVPPEVAKEIWDSLHKGSCVKEAEPLVVTVNLDSSAIAAAFKPVYRSWRIGGENDEA